MVLVFEALQYLELVGFTFRWSDFPPVSVFHIHITLLLLDVIGRSSPPATSPLFLCCHLYIVTFTLLLLQCYLYIVILRCNWEKFSAGYITPAQRIAPLLILLLIILG